MVAHDQQWDGSRLCSRSAGWAWLNINITDVDVFCNWAGQDLTPWAGRGPEYYAQGLNRLSLDNCGLVWPCSSQ